MNELRKQFDERIGRFGRVRRGMANATLTYGVGAPMLGVGIAALLLLSGWTDNPFVNGALTLAGCFALLRLLVQFWKGWERRRSVLSEAFRAEALAGDLNSRIISAMDFVDWAEPTPLTEVVIEQARQDLGRPFESLLDRGTLRRRRNRFILLLAVFLAVGSTPWFSFSRLGHTVAQCTMNLREILLPTRFEMFPGTKVCRIGASVDAGLRFTRFRYPEVTMVTQMSDREGEERSVLKVDPSGRATMTLKPTVEREYRIRFAFGKRVTEEMKLVFTTTPIIENMQVELVYPVYTRLVPKETEGILDRITALPGTRVNMGFVFSKALKSAVLKFDDKTRMPLEVVGRFASVSFIHSAERGATMQVEDIHGFALDKPHSIDFGLAVDNPPKLYPPKHYKLDMPFSVDQLAGETFGVKVEDDFGAAKCVVKWHKSRTEKPNEVTVKGEPIERVFIPPRRTAVAVFESIFREQAQTATGGDLFTFQIEAFDNRDPKPQLAVSSMYSIFISGNAGERGSAEGGIDVMGPFLNPLGKTKREFPKVEGGGRVTKRPSKQDTAEAYRNEVKVDRTSGARGELPGPLGDAAGAYGSGAIGASGSGAK